MARPFLFPRYLLAREVSHIHCDEATCSDSLGLTTISCLKFALRMRSSHSIPELLQECYLNVTNVRRISIKSLDHPRRERGSFIHEWGTFRSTMGLSYWSFMNSLFRSLRPALWGPNTGQILTYQPRPWQH